MDYRSSHKLGRRALLVIALFVVIGQVYAKIYKWVDEKGVTHYTDSPPDGKGQELAPTQAPSDEEVERAKERLDRRLEQQRRREESRQEQREKIQQQKAAKQREKVESKKRCIRARQNLHVLEIQRPVYWIDEKGERVFLDDDTRTRKIERMKANIETYCRP